jgi:hypothetical protein
LLVDGLVADAVDGQHDGLAHGLEGVQKPERALVRVVAVVQRPARRGVDDQSVEGMVEVVSREGVEVRLLLVRLLLAAPEEGHGSREGEQAEARGHDSRVTG